VDSFQEATLRVGDSVLVRLPSSATSGYLWQVAESGDQVQVVKESASREEGRRLPIGSSPDEVFRVIGVDPGETTVIFTQAQPWEPDEVVNRHFLSVRVHS
jgi:predicted secreted protein